MAILIGHSSSAYSLLVVMPIGKVMTAERMIACQPQKWKRARAREGMGALSRRCIE